jgi:hypothetical protein
MDVDTITVACSICGRATEMHAPGVEPICLACFAGEALRCCECPGTAESVCGTCGELICGGDLCLRVHEHAPWPVREART